MSITSFKITDSDISSKGVVAAPTVLSGSPEENKRIFDRLVREVLKGDFNALVDALAATTGAGEIGAAVEGLTGETVQAILSALKTLLDSKAASADMEAALGGKSDTSVTDAHFKSVAFDAGTGVFTFTKENGTTVTVDTALEKVAVNFAYDEDTQSLVLTLADGSTQHVSLASFLTTTEFEDSNTIEWSVSGSTVRATVKSGSITDAMLSSTLKTMLQGYVSAAANSATNAEASATNAANNAARSLGYQNAARAAAKEAEASQQEAKADADRAASASAHQPQISSDGYWELWDLTQGVYVKTAHKANGADGDPGIVISATQPTAESHPVWINPEGEASPAEGTDLSLGITSASVGQIAKITAVDESGKPTAWEAVDMPSGGGGGHWETVLDTVWEQAVINPTAFDSETGIFTCAEGELDNLALDTEYAFFQQCVKEGVAYNTILDHDNLKVTKLSDTTFSIDVTPSTTFVPTNVKFSRGACLAITDIDAKKIRLTLDGQFKPTATPYDRPFYKTNVSYFGWNNGYQEIRNAYNAYQQVTAEVESPYRIVGEILCGFNAPSATASFHFKNNSFCCPLIPYDVPEGNERTYLLTSDGTKIAKLYSTSAPWCLGGRLENTAISFDYLKIISGTKVKLERWVE